MKIFKDFVVYMKSYASDIECAVVLLGLAVAVVFTLFWMFELMGVAGAAVFVLIVGVSYLLVRFTMWRRARETEMSDV